MHRTGDAAYEDRERTIDAMAAHLPAAREVAEHAFAVESGAEQPCVSCGVGGITGLIKGVHLAEAFGMHLRVDDGGVGISASSSRGASPASTTSAACSTRSWTMTRRSG